MNEYLCVEEYLIIGIFPTWFGLELWAFSPNPQGKYSKKLYFF